MAVRELSEAPGTLSIYAKAAAAMVPGASVLPFVGGAGSELPDIEPTLGAGVDLERLAAYSKVCGFVQRDTLPITYPHILAFPLHMALMTDSDFPFPAVGLVHLSNSITQHRPISVRESLALRVRPTGLEPHPKGRTFSIVTEARVGEELAWESTSTMLRRGGGSSQPAAEPKAKATAEPVELPSLSTWRLPDNLGRRYGSVSGDRNPIHMHDLSAKLLGFKRAIAHGMWTKARCLASLDAHAPDSYTAEVSFRRPIFLPAKVEFAALEEGGKTRFAVRGARTGEPHLDGSLEGR